MPFLAETVDVIIVGAGHAGCEAALASARLGLKTILFSISLDAVALMPCNPSIGGSSKGHLVREIDALGGEMGVNIDKTYLQSKMLNRGKGPAVHSPRAQADKFEYAKKMKQTIENTDNLWLRQGEVQEILVENGAVQGVITTSQAIYHAKAIVLCTGTYLNARCLYGETIVESGPNGLKAAQGLTESLKELGVGMFRFKTGTPARVDKKSIDFSKMEIQWGDEDPAPFSFTHTKEDIKRDFVPCYLTYTNETTHEIIQNNLHRSPMYAGVIEGTGTRYCPSIEDKIVRFADKNRHQIFIEPEGQDTQEMYIQGMSTSLPEDVQIQMYRSIPGLENCRIMRTAYAIEYNCIDATQLSLSLEFKKIKGLFAAGQFNGSSGYEEAAAQGLIAGINAANSVLGREPFILKRSDGYIGVLIDDLVTKGTKEPYRMMTSRSEYRLLLRQDNADIRLTPMGFQQGLIPEKRHRKLQEKIFQIEEEIKRLQGMIIPPKEEVNQLLRQQNSSPIQTGVSMVDLIKRPELSYQLLLPLDPERNPLAEDITEQVNIQIKYEGYINRQKMQVEQFKKMENKILPENFDYNLVQGLRLEAIQKLNAIQPKNVGHASRITGVSPADISVLYIYLEKNKTNIS